MKEKNKITKCMTLIIGFIVGVVFASSIAVYAVVNASDINYTRTGTNITSVEDALNDLYAKNVEIRKIENINSTTKSYTAEFDFSDVSNYRLLTAEDFYVNPEGRTQIYLNSAGGNLYVDSTKSYNNSTGILTVTITDADDAACNGIYFRIPQVIAILGIPST